jgi:cytochrome P450
LPAALRDPSVFPAADVFDIGRDQTANVTFGTGPHHCVGAALARLEGQVAIATLLERFPRMRLVGEPTFAPHSFLRKMQSLPIAVE